MMDRKGHARRNSHRTLQPHLAPCHLRADLAHSVAHRLRRGNEGRTCLGQGEAARLAVKEFDIQLRLDQFDLSPQCRLAGAQAPEQPPHLETTRKGRIRIAMEQAYRASGVQTIILRAGNLIGPDGNGDIMRLFVLRDIAKGRITARSDPDTMQAYTYVPDWARVAVMLAERRMTLGQFEDVPFAGHSFTITQMHDTLAHRTGRDLTITQFPWWMMTLLSPIWELARELREMRFLYALDHRISGTKHARLRPDFTPTDMETVMCAGVTARDRSTQDGEDPQHHHPRRAAWHWPRQGQARKCQPRRSSSRAKAAGS
jgi:hypothetical protein